MVPPKALTARVRHRPSRLTRRQFATLWVGAVAALCGPRPSPVRAASPAVAETPPPLTGPWARLTAAVAEIQTLESSPENQHILARAREAVAQLEPVHATRAQRLDRVIGLVMRQAGTHPSFLDECRPSLGSLSLTPEDVTVFFLERSALENGKRELEERAEYLRATHRTRSPEDRGASFDELLGKVRQATEHLNQYVGVAAKDGCRAQEPTIAMDPDIDPTPEGMREFEHDRALLGKELETFRQYGAVCSRYVISSDRYGPRNAKTIFDVALGAFEPFKPEHSPLFYGLHSLAMNPKSEIGSFGRRITLFHEAFGHGTSALVNPALANMLTEQQWVERATFEMQIMNNVDWAANDGSIPELFRRYPRVSNFEEYIANAAHVDADTFSGLVRRYPMRRLLEPVSVRLPSSENELTLKVDSLIDVVAASGKPSLRSITKPEQPEQAYDNWDAFAQAYMPMLHADAISGNVRARVLWAGLGEYARELGNDSMLVDQVATGEDRSGAAWAKRVNASFANVIVYHLFLNGSIGGTDYRTYFTPSERQELEKRVYEKRALYRGELWAEGIAYSHQFGDRLEDNPYRDALRHIASMIVS